MAGSLTGRKARLAMADVRALEEQAERINPVAPSKGRGKKLLGATKGAGATPSVGLSQFRGGAKAFDDEAFAMMDLMPSGEYDGRGLSGGAETGAYQGEGLSGGGHIIGAGAGVPKKAKRVIAHDDPRRRRAQLVGKIMKERGCSLAEASKIVKAEGMHY